MQRPSDPSPPPIAVWGPVVWRFLQYLEASSPDWGQITVAVFAQILPVPNLSPHRLRNSNELHDRLRALVGRNTFPRPRPSPMTRQEAELTFVAIVLFLKAHVTLFPGSRIDMGSDDTHWENINHMIGLVCNSGDFVSFGDPRPFTRFEVRDALRAFRPRTWGTFRTPSLATLGLEPFHGFAAILARSDPFHANLWTLFAFGRFYFEYGLAPRG